jgi:hypothetical protein
MARQAIDEPHSTENSEEPEKKTGKGVPGLVRIRGIGRR